MMSSPVSREVIRRLRQRNKGLFDYLDS